MFNSVHKSVKSTVSDDAMLLMYFFFNDTATTEIYTLSLHDALPIFTTSDLNIILMRINNILPSLESEFDL